MKVGGERGDLEPEGERIGVKWGGVRMIWALRWAFESLSFLSWHFGEILGLPVPQGPTRHLSPELSLPRAGQAPSCQCGALSRAERTVGVGEGVVAPASELKVCVSAHMYTCVCM